MYKRVALTFNDHFICKYSGRIFNRIYYHFREE